MEMIEMGLPVFRTALDTLIGRAGRVFPSIWDTRACAGPQPALVRWVRS